MKKYLEQIVNYLKGIFELLKKYFEKKPETKPEDPKPPVVVTPLPPIDVVPEPTPVPTKPVNPFDQYKGQEVAYVILWVLHRAPTDLELTQMREAGVVFPEVVKPSEPVNMNVDKTQVRNLSGNQGNMGHAHGPAGSQHVFTVQEPFGKKVQITTGKIQSNWGSNDHVLIAGYGQFSEGRFDAHAMIEFPADGKEQQVIVTLVNAGGVAVQRN